MTRGLRRFDSKLKRFRARLIVGLCLTLFIVVGAQARATNSGGSYL